MNKFYSALGCLLAVLMVPAWGADQGRKAFNPAISAVLMGHAYYDNRHSKIPGWQDAASTFPNQGEGEYSHRGFNLDGSELSFSSNVDNYFKLWLAAAYEDDEVEVEEAWLETTDLPYGLRIKAGRFLSDIGYHNTKHQHQWDFIDQNLAYQALFHGEHLSGDGVQLNWLLPTDNYWRVGVEAMQGGGLNGFGQGLDDDQVLEELGRLGPTPSNVNLEEHAGPNLVSGFMHFSHDMGTRQALQLGLSSSFHRNQRNVLDIGTPVAAAGHAWLGGVQAIYKRFADDAYGTHGLTVTAEYFYAASKLKIDFPSGLSDNQVRQRQQAGYLQALYGFAPRWQVGFRHAASGLGNSRTKAAGQTDSVGHSRQDDMVLAWRLSEFSKLRLQAGYSRLHLPVEDAVRSGFQVMLGYVMTIGAHPAHEF